MKEEKEVKVEKIVLNIDGDKIPLTIEQAKKLKDILGDMFGKEVVHHYHDNWWYRPYYATPIWSNYNSDIKTINTVNYCANTLSLEVKC